MNAQEHRQTADAIDLIESHPKNWSHTQWFSVCNEIWNDHESLDDAKESIEANRKMRIRIKPTPVSRPWSKPSDVPGPVCWIRDIGQESYGSMIIGMHPEGIERVGYSLRISLLPWCHCLNKEHSIDRKTWAKCEVIE